MEQLFTGRREKSANGRKRTEQWSLRGAKGRTSGRGETEEGPRSESKAGEGSDAFLYRSPQPIMGAERRSGFDFTRRVTLSTNGESNRSC
jgi:hypothetical protein